MNEKAMNEWFLLYNGTSLLDYLPLSLRDALLLILQTPVSPTGKSEVIENVAELLGELCSDNETIEKLLELLVMRDRLTPQEMLKIVSILKTSTMKLSEAESLIQFYRNSPEAIQKNISVRALQKIFSPLFLKEIDIRLQCLYRTVLFFNKKDDFPSIKEGSHFLKSYRNEVVVLLKKINPAKITAWLSTAEHVVPLDLFLLRLRQQAFAFNQINFRFTYHCNAACRHCYNFSGPDKKGAHLSEEIIYKILHDMPRCGINHVVLTGGEPFLYPDFVYKTVREARKLGLGKFIIPSNGFWGENLDILKNLKTAGFMNESADYLEISSGIYHQEFVPVETILRLTENHYETFHRPLHIDYEIVDEKEKVEFEKLLAQRGLTRKTRVAYRDVYPLGRGEIVEKSAAMKPLGKISPCNSLGKILVVEPDGSVRPCCGLNSDIDGFVIANINNQGLPEIIEDILNSPFLQLIASTPFERMFSVLKQKPEKKEYSGSCEICRELFAEDNSEEINRHLIPLRGEFYPFCNDENLLTS